jgi:hypothetical protein
VDPKHTGGLAGKDGQTDGRAGVNLLNSNKLNWPGRLQACRAGSEKHFGFLFSAPAKNARFVRGTGEVGEIHIGNREVVFHDSDFRSDDLEGADGCDEKWVSTERWERDARLF